MGFVLNVDILAIEARIVVFIQTRPPYLRYAANAVRGYMMSANLDANFIISKMLVNCRVIFNVMAFETSIRRTLCGGDLTM
jgi:hypothetical protein